MKVLLTTAMTLGILLSMLEQNVEARGGGGRGGGGHNERGGGARSMESRPAENLGNSQAGSLNNHANEGHLEKNVESNTNRNWQGDAGWEGTGGWGDEGENLTGCAYNTTGELVCP